VINAIDAPKHDLTTDRANDELTGDGVLRRRASARCAAACGEAESRKRARSSLLPGLLSYLPRPSLPPSRTATKPSPAAMASDYDKYLRYPQDSSTLAAVRTTEKQTFVWVPEASDFGFAPAEVLQEEGNSVTVRLSNGEVGTAALSLPLPLTPHNLVADSWCWWYYSRPLLAVVRTNERTNERWRATRHERATTGAQG